MARILELLSVVLLLLFVLVFAWVGYEMYIYMGALADRGKQHMAKKHNVTFNKDGGLRVGVKEINDDQYRDHTQSYLVKAWNLSNFPAYKSRFWNKQADAQGLAPTGGALRPQAPSHESSSTGARPKVGSRESSGAAVKRS